MNSRMTTKLPGRSMSWENGNSLNRVSAREPGFRPSNWTAAAASPGTAEFTNRIVGDVNGRWLVQSAGYCQSLAGWKISDRCGRRVRRRRFQWRRSVRSTRHYRGKFGRVPLGQDSWRSVRSQSPVLVRREYCLPRRFGFFTSRLPAYAPSHFGTTRFLSAADSRQPKTADIGLKTSNPPSRSLP